MFVSALGDRSATFRGSLALATLATGIAAVLFSWILKFQLPLLHS